MTTRNAPLTSDAAFARAFEEGAIAPADFHHAAHIRLALAYLAECGSTEAAIDRMAAALRRFAAAAGHADKYHHTLTVFWVRVIAQLLDAGLPFDYYSRERLASDAARQGWIEPDLRPIAERRRQELGNSRGRTKAGAAFGPHRR
jgi:hypothetical protein